MFSKLFCVVVGLALLGSGRAQYNATALNEKLETIHNNDAATDLQKMQQVQRLAAQFAVQKLPPDSVYALMLHRIGIYLNNQGRFTESIDYTRRAMQVNVSGKAACCPAYSIKHLNNVAWCYECLHNYKMAVQYYQQAMEAARRFPWRIADILITYQHLASLQLEEENYQEVIRYARLGLQKVTDSFLIYKAFFCGVIADAAVEIGNYPLARTYLPQAIAAYQKKEREVSVMGCLLTNARLLLLEGHPEKVLPLLEQIAGFYARLDDRDYQSLGLLNLGIFYRDALHNPTKAALFFQKTISLYPDSLQSQFNCISAYNNLGQVYSLQHQYHKALQCYQRALAKQARQFARSSLLQNPLLVQLTTLPDNNLSFIILHNKAETLLQVYLQNGNPAYLAASGQTYLLADSVLTHMKLNQSEQETKLHWRKRSRNFYQQALQMCYVAHNPKLAFYFMEKSRAVLLNDYVNEAAAVHHLPEADRTQEAGAKAAVLEKQLQLSSLPPGHPGGAALLNQLLEKQVQLEQLTRRLEARHPAYAHSRDVEDVLPVEKLQSYLARNRQQWVQYFLSDTLLFVLYADGNRLQLHRSLVKDMEARLPLFVNHCADIEKQSRNFTGFVQAAHSLYDTLLGPLPLKPGRLIISPDNLLLPFDALCTRSGPPHRWMVEDFAISYAYAARLLLKPMVLGKAEPEGDFLGMAPVQFPAAMRLPELKGSDGALQQLESCYPHSKLLTGANATSEHFFARLPRYTVANLYTHARANSGDSVEPQLYFSDCSVFLTGLQQLTNVATQLVVLTACQTNAGRLASGEGVFSLARGFAMASIPAVVATLWTADANATYFIAQQFHEGLSQGIPKDIALQQAKLAYLKRGGRKQLPYLWANLTLTGSAAPLQMVPQPASHQWLITGLLAGLAGIGLLFLLRRKLRPAP